MPSQTYISSNVIRALLNVEVGLSGATTSEIRHKLYVHNLIFKNTRGEHAITPKGEAYIRFLRQTPLPVQRPEPPKVHWMDPRDTHTPHN